MELALGVRNWQQAIFIYHHAPRSWKVPSENRSVPSATVVVVELSPFPLMTASGVDRFGFF